MTAKSPAGRHLNPACDGEPLAASSVPPAGWGRNRAENRMDQRQHIVVVEDEATQRQLLVDYLGRQNFHVTGVDGGTPLRRLIDRDLPALVLLDVGLPGGGGFALARWLREKSGRLGIIMVTAAADTV